MSAHRTSGHNQKSLAEVRQLFDVSIHGLKEAAVRSLYRRYGVFAPPSDSYFTTPAEEAEYQSRKFSECVKKVNDIWNIGSENPSESLSAIEGLYAHRFTVLTPLGEIVAGQNQKHLDPNSFCPDYDPRPLLEMLRTLAAGLGLTPPAWPSQMSLDAALSWCDRFFADLPCQSITSRQPAISPRISVGFEPEQVTLDGKAYTVSPNAALLFNGLVEANGDWVASKSVHNIRTARVKRTLPPQLRPLIEAERGKGSRLRLP